MENFILNVSDPAVALTAGVRSFIFRLPYDFVCLAVRAALTSAQVSGSPVTIDVRKSGTSILSTLLTINNGALTSKTASDPAVIAWPMMEDDAEVSIDVPIVGDGTARGLKVTMIGYRPVNLTAPPQQTELLVDRTLGTHFGNMTGFGLSWGFDGVTNAPGINCAAHSAGPGYLGTTWNVGKRFSRALVYGRNDVDGFGKDDFGPVTIAIYGKNGTPSNGTDGTLLGSVTFTNTVNESGGREIVSNNSVTPYTSIWAYINCGTYSTYCAELVLYERI